MIAHAETSPAGPAQSTSKTHRNGHNPVLEDAAKSRAGLSYRTVSVSPKKGGRAIKRDRKSWERRAGGEVHSPLSRLSQEALHMEQDGLCTAFMVVHLKANAMMSELRKRSRAEIEAELLSLYQEEQSANGCFDMVQFKDLSDGRIASPELREELGRCARIQAAKSERIVALLDRLEELDAAGGR